MSAPGTVRARWVPLWGADLADGTHLEHGAEYDVPAEEAHASDNWAFVTSPAKPPTPVKPSKDEE